MVDRPPPTNLSPLAEPWGRWATDQTVFNAEAIERLGGDASNDGRINNGAMDTMASQISELYARQSVYLQAPDISTVSFIESSGTVSASTNIQIPKPIGGTRTGWLTVTGTPSVSPALSSNLFVTYSIDGRIFYRSSISLPIFTSTPAGWSNVSFSGSTGFTVDPTLPGGVITVQLQAMPQAFGDVGARVASLTNISATAAYGQRE